MLNQLRLPIFFLLLGTALFVFGEDLSAFLNAGENGFTALLFIALLISLIGVILLSAALFRTVFGLLILPRVTPTPNKEVIQSSLGCVFGVLFFVALIGGFITYGLWSLYKAGDSSRFVWLVLAVCASLIESWLIFISGTVFFRWRRFGVCALELEPGCAIVGGRVIGIVRPGIKSKPIGETKIKLCCVREITQMVQNSCETEKRVEFQIEDIIPAEKANFASGIPIELDIPPGLPESRETNTGSEKVSWELRVYVPLTGANYDAQFTIPVKAARSPTNAKPNH